MKKKLLACLISIMLLAIALPVVTTGAKRLGRGTIRIIRDNYGVPHVFANTKEGLAFGAGYAMAQDRLWQADLFRRQAFGSLAYFGFASIDDDYETRSLWYSREELREIFDSWEPIDPKARIKEMWIAHVDGINLYISQALADPSLMPVEYFPGVITPDGLPLEPWTIEDSIAIMVMMAWRFGGAGGDELQYATALQALQAMYPADPAVAWAIFNDLFPQNDPGAEVTIPSESSSHSSSSMPEILLPSNIGDIYREYEEARMGQTQLFESLGLPTEFGSNAWVVSPRKSKTRNTLQVGGPQMGHSIPQIVSEIGLHGAGINAVGMMMPMAPVILIGVSEHGAWTSTSGISDTFDTYIEVLNPENQYQYWYDDGTGGKWVNMEKRTETFYGYWSTGYNETKDVYRTVHGPIIYWDLPNNAYTMKAAFFKKETAAEEGWSLFQQAKNIGDFQEAVKTIMPSHNFLWIDRDGNIGYWHAGQYPIKPAGVDDRLPMWGTGEQEWIGLTGFEEMPKSINPDQSWLTNWNNKPIANWPYAESDAGWGEGHRIKRIMDLLAAGKKFTFEDMNKINIDAGYNHIPGMNFLHYLIEAAITDPDVAAALPYLEAWNHHYNDVLDPKWDTTTINWTNITDATYDDPGLTVFDAWYDRIFDEVFADDIPESIMNVSEWQSSTLIHVFDGLTSELPLNYDYLNGEAWDALITRVLEDALADLEATYGSDMSTWLTDVDTDTFFPQGALPAPTMHEMNRGTYNHIAEMPRTKKPPHAVDVIPPGQSGFMNYLFEFNHAYDQLPLYETWTYKPMLYKYSSIKAVAESTTILIYP